MNFFASLESIVVLLAMAIPGFLMGKSKKVNVDEAIKTLSVILLYICQPFINVNSFLNTMYSRDILINMVFVFVITAILMAALLLLGAAIFRKNKINGSVYAFSSSLGNIGYLCIPFLQMLTPDLTVLLYAAVSLVSFNLVGWTMGAYLLTGNKKHISIKNAVLNFPTLSFILVLPFFLLNLNFIRFPMRAVSNAVSLFASLTAPLSMTLVGLQFTKMNPISVFTDKRAYLTAAIKLILSPFVCLALFHLFNLMFDLSAIKLNVIALSAMPSATVIIMFASLYDKDREAAARSVLLTTLLSIITIPLALLLVGI